MTESGFESVFLSLLVICCKILVIRGCGPPQDQCRDQVYVLSIPDKALVGHVISDNIVAATPQLCRIQCYLEPKCMSYNFDQNARDSPNCELSSSDAETHPGDLADRPGMIYQGTKNKCHKVTCPPLMECHSDYGPQGYRCTYPHKCCQANQESNLFIPTIVEAKALTVLPLESVPKKRVLHFPRKSVEDYIKVTTTFKTSLTAFTISLMARLQNIQDGQEPSPFTLASSTSINSVALFFSQTLFYVYVSDDERKVPVALNDGKWHHICATWESTSGNWQLYVDGRIQDHGTKLAAGKVIENGIAIIGQDQDSIGGGFAPHQSFGKGRLTSISLWDRVLPAHDGSFSFLTNFECHPQPGQVLSWEDILKAEQHGDITIQG